MESDIPTIESEQPEERKRFDCYANAPNDRLRKIIEKYSSRRFYCYTNAPKYRRRKMIEKYSSKRYMLNTRLIKVMKSFERRKNKLWISKMKRRITRRNPTASTSFSSQSADESASVISNSTATDENTDQIRSNVSEIVSTQVFSSQRGLPQAENKSTSSIPANATTREKTDRHSSEIVLSQSGAVLSLEPELKQTENESASSISLSVTADGKTQQLQLNTSNMVSSWSRAVLSSQTERSQAENQRNYLILAILSTMPSITIQKVTTTNEELRSNVQSLETVSSQSNSVLSLQLGPPQAQNESISPIVHSTTSDENTDQLQLNVSEMASSQSNTVLSSQPGQPQTENISISNIADKHTGESQSSVQSSEIVSSESSAVISLESGLPGTENKTTADGNTNQLPLNGSKMVSCQSSASICSHSKLPKAENESTFNRSPLKIESLEIVPSESGAVICLKPELPLVENESTSSISNSTTADEDNDRIQSNVPEVFSSQSSTVLSLRPGLPQAENISISAIADKNTDGLQAQSNDQSSELFSSESSAVLSLEPNLPQAGHESTSSISNSTSANGNTDQLKLKLSEMVSSQSSTVLFFQPGLPKTENESTSLISNNTTTNKKTVNRQLKVESSEVVSSESGAILSLKPELPRSRNESTSSASNSTSANENTDQLQLNLSEIVSYQSSTVSSSFPVLSQTENENISPISNITTVDENTDQLQSDVPEVVSSQSSAVLSSPPPQADYENTFSVSNSTTAGENTNQLQLNHQSSEVALCLPSTVLPSNISNAQHDSNEEDPINEVKGDVRKQKLEKKVNIKLVPSEFYSYLSTEKENTKQKTAVKPKRKRKRLTVRKRSRKNVSRFSHRKNNNTGIVCPDPYAKDSENLNWEKADVEGKAALIVHLGAGRPVHPVVHRNIMKLCQRKNAQMTDTWAEFSLSTLVENPNHCPVKPILMPVVEESLLSAVTRFRENRNIDLKELEVTKVVSSKPFLQVQEDTGPDQCSMEEIVSREADPSMETSTVDANLLLCKLKPCWVILKRLDEANSLVGEFPVLPNKLIQSAPETFELHNQEISSPTNVTPQDQSSNELVTQINLSYRSFLNEISLEPNHSPTEMKYKTVKACENQTSFLDQSNSLIGELYDFETIQPAFNLNKSNEPIQPASNVNESSNLFGKFSDLSCQSVQSVPDVDKSSSLVSKFSDFTIQPASNSTESSKPVGQFSDLYSQPIQSMPEGGKSSGLVGEFSDLYDQQIQPMSNLNESSSLVSKFSDLLIQPASNPTESGSPVGKFSDLPEQPKQSAPYLDKFSSLVDKFSDLSSRPIQSVPDLDKSSSLVGEFSDLHDQQIQPVSNLNESSSLVRKFSDFPIEPASNPTESSSPVGKFSDLPRQLKQSAPDLYNSSTLVDKFSQPIICAFDLNESNNLVGKFSELSNQPMQSEPEKHELQNREKSSPINVTLQDQFSIELLPKVTLTPESLSNQSFLNETGLKLDHLSENQISPVKDKIAHAHSFAGIKIHTIFDSDDETDEKPLKNQNLFSSSLSLKYQIERAISSVGIKLYTVSFDSDDETDKGTSRKLMSFSSSPLVKDEVQNAISCTGIEVYTISSDSDNETDEEASGKQILVSSTLPAVDSSLEEEIQIISDHKTTLQSEMEVTKGDQISAFFNVDSSLKEPREQTNLSEAPIIQNQSLCLPLEKNVNLSSPPVETHAVESIYSQVEPRELVTLLEAPIIQYQSFCLPVPLEKSANLSYPSVKTHAVESISTQEEPTESEAPIIQNQSLCLPVPQEKSANLLSHPMETSAVESISTQKESEASIIRNQSSCLPVPLEKSAILSSHPVETPAIESISTQEEPSEQENLSETSFIQNQSLCLPLKKIAELLSQSVETQEVDSVSDNSDNSEDSVGREVSTQNYFGLEHCSKTYGPPVDYVSRNKTLIYLHKIKRILRCQRENNKVFQTCTFLNASRSTFEDHFVEILSDVNEDVEDASDVRVVSNEFSTFDEAAMRKGRKSTTFSCNPTEVLRLSRKKVKFFGFSVLRNMSNLNPVPLRVVNSDDFDNLTNTKWIIIQLHEDICELIYNNLCTFAARSLFEIMYQADLSKKIVYLPIDDPNHDGSPELGIYGVPGLCDTVILGPCRAPERCYSLQANLQTISQEFEIVGIPIKGYRLSDVTNKLSNANIQAVWWRPVCKPLEVTRINADYLSFLFKCHGTAPFDTQKKELEISRLMKKHQVTSFTYFPGSDGEINYRLSHEWPMDISKESVEINKKKGKSTLPSAAVRIASSFSSSSGTSSSIAEKNPNTLQELKDKEKLLKKKIIKMNGALLKSVVDGHKELPSSEVENKSILKTTIATIKMLKEEHLVLLKEKETLKKHRKHLLSKFESLSEGEDKHAIFIKKTILSRLFCPKNRELVKRENLSFSPSDSTPDYESTVRGTKSADIDDAPLTMQCLERKRKSSETISTGADVSKSNEIRDPRLQKKKIILSLTLPKNEGLVERKSLGYSSPASRRKSDHVSTECADTDGVNLSTQRLRKKWGRPSNRSKAVSTGIKTSESVQSENSESVTFSTNTKVPKLVQVENAECSGSNGSNFITQHLKRKRGRPSAKRGKAVFISAETSESVQSEDSENVAVLTSTHLPKVLREEDVECADKHEVNLPTQCFGRKQGRPSKRSNVISTSVKVPESVRPVDAGNNTDAGRDLDIDGVNLSTQRLGRKEERSPKRSKVVPTCGDAPESVQSVDVGSNTVTEEERSPESSEVVSTSADAPRAVQSDDVGSCAVSTNAEAPNFIRTNDAEQPLSKPVHVTVQLGNRTIKLGPYTVDTLKDTSNDIRPIGNVVISSNTDKNDIGTINICVIEDGMSIFKLAIDPKKECDVEEIDCGRNMKTLMKHVLHVLKVKLSKLSSSEYTLSGNHIRLLQSIISDSRNEHDFAEISLSQKNLTTVSLDHNYHTKTDKLK